MPQFQIVTQAPLFAFIGMFLMLGGVVLLLFGLGVIQSGTGQDIILKFSSGRKTTLMGLVGIILGGIAVFLSVSTSTSEPRLPDPTDTNEAILADTTEPTSTAIVDTGSGIYDDFNDPELDRGLNTSLWEPFVTPPSYIEQQNGVLVILLEPGTQEEVSLYADLNLVADQSHFIESRILLSSEVTEVGGGAGFDIAIDLFGGQKLETWCAISREGSQTALVACTVADGYGSAGVRTEMDTWHTARMEMDSDINMTFYVDGELVGFYRPENADQVKGRPFTVRLAAWRPEQDGGVKANFDDVRIGQSGE